MTDPAPSNVHGQDAAAPVAAPVEAAVAVKPRWSLRRAGAPAGLLVRAAILAAVFGVLHLLGLRQYTAVLSGTASFDTLHQVYGVLYLLFYAAFVLVVPILTIASVLLWGAQRMGWPPPAAPAGAPHTPTDSHEQSQLPSKENP